MKQRLLCFVGITLLCAPVFGSANDSPWQWSAGASLGTERVWRGQSQTDGNPSVVGEIKLSHASGFFTGIWAGNLDLGPRTDTHAELDYFLGWSKKIGHLSINTGYLYRQRPSDALSLDFQEATASASYDFGIARLGAGEYYSWDYFQGGRSYYSYTNLRVPLGKAHGVRFLALAEVGHYDFTNRTIGDYNDIDLRAVAMVHSWEISVGFSDTNVDPERSGLLTRDRCGPRWRGQVLYMFF